MSSLDDFFAKKDKKKGGKGKKFSKANTDILAKNLEEQEKKEAEGNVKTSVPLATSEVNKAQAALASNNDNTAEDEWKEYDEEKKDYSNLKIETLKVESDEEEAGNDDEHEINEDGEKVPKKEGGVWSKGKAEEMRFVLNEDGTAWKIGVNGNNGVNCVSATKTEDEQDIEELRRREKERAKAELESSIGAPKGSVVGGSYVPPHMRGSAAGGGGERQSSQLAPMRGGPRRTKHVPDMNSEINFPSLGGETTGSNTHAERDFEEVRGSGSNQNHTSRGSDGPNMALSNKFAALRN